MAGSGASIVVVLKVLLPLFGIDIPDETVGELVEAGFVLIGTILLVVGQLRRKDLVGGIVRK